MIQAFIIDFDDSFTFNISNVLESMNIKTMTISYRNIEESVDLLISNERKLIIWGPGPKHPEFYSHLFPLISKLRKLKQNYHIGICLGHQLLLLIDGYKILPAKNIKHGQNIEIKIPDWNCFFNESEHGKIIKVQRYNSLAVDASSNSKHLSSEIEGEVMIAGYKNGVSYQFHPESIGTSFPELFFKSPINFLYNNNDERETQSNGYL